ncbi:ShlB/FhaC/HecB family hemolysin secretion/activation protein [Chromatium okenii]|uniref:ShlB/FhaC/HecB family hemolysin secretion/activation protein n=1 Tax=Chromatium okenii TaxID=61644 RepID=UPI0026EB8C75|nr:ShlB/FhaC/HecB family hemolysin secretion/activation protein [Chromatium okenii]MBV5309479.1 ShlB/FhaC/HecB family hemolysin secretion/activation protein [Chromatium okenii]
MNKQLCVIWLALLWLPMATSGAVENLNPPNPPLLKGGFSTPPLEKGGQGGFLLNRVQFEGGAALPQTELNAIVAPAIGQRMTLADVEELRYRLTKHYVDQGFINSGVVIKPDQTLTDGVLIFQIIPGQLTEIRVSGQERLRPSYLTKRLQPDPTAPFNRLKLQDHFQLLLQDPLIAQLKGTLLPGAAPASAVLDLDVTRARAWDVALRTDNHRPPSTGAERAYLTGTVRNLTGFGDALDLNIGHGYEGDGREGSISWSLPLTARDTRLALRYERNDASLIEEPLADLAIDSATERLMVDVSHPLWHTLQSTLRLGAQLSHAENTTHLLGEPFSFSEGVVNGASQVTALRLSQEYSRRLTQQAFALRSVFSYGMDALDATIHAGNTPDSRFVAWLGQGQYVRQLSQHGTQMIVRGSLQLAGERLLALEQFSIGGAGSVRGYRENQLVGDNGYTASAEVRYPVWEGVKFFAAKQVLQLAVFTDVGNAWDHGHYSERDGDLWSIGVGAVWTIEKRLQAELYFGHALNDPPPEKEHDWQDEGVHFMVQVDF